MEASSRLAEAKVKAITVETERHKLSKLVLVMLKVASGQKWRALARWKLKALKRSMELNSAKRLERAVEEARKAQVRWLQRAPMCLACAEAKRRIGRYRSTYFILNQIAFKASEDDQKISERMERIKTVSEKEIKKLHEKRQCLESELGGLRLAHALDRRNSKLLAMARIWNNHTVLNMHRSFLTWRQNGYVCGCDHDYGRIFYC